MSLFLLRCSRPLGGALQAFRVVAQTTGRSRPLTSLALASSTPFTGDSDASSLFLVPSLQQYQFRFKNKHAKVGQHLKQLDEMAHQKKHNEAVEKRKKKKEKTLARKGKGAAKAEAIAHLAAEHGDDDSYQDPAEEEYEDDQTVLPDINEVEKRMKKHIDAYQDYLKSVRGGEPSPELFDDIIVQDAYGKGSGSTPLKAVAQVVVSSPTLATATCFDPATAKAVSNAIRDKLELNPQLEEAGVISIPIPRVSMESRQQTAKNVNKRTEVYRQRIRKTRQTAMDIIKQGVAGKLEGISKDDAFRMQQKVEDVTAKQIAVLNEIAEKKQNEIMQV